MPRKATIRREILELLEKSARSVGDFLDSLTTPYISPYRRLRSPSLYPRQRLAKKDKEAEARQRLYDVLSRLKRDQLIEKSKDGFWHITAKGRKRRKEIIAHARNLPASHWYTQEESPTWNIVMFDIPEKERRKRNWLRTVLGQIGFRMLQESVWIGKVTIPRALIEDLHKLHLLGYMEILAITKHGSLRQLR